MQRSVINTRRRRVLRTTGGALVGGVLASSTASANKHDETDEDERGHDEIATNYEVWALDQGTDTAYIYEPVEDDDHPSFELLEEIDFRTLEGVTPNEEGAVTPHMIAFSSDHAYAAVACTAAGQTLVFRTDDRELVGSCPTGPGSHFAGFTPDDENIQVDVIGTGTIARIDANLEDEEFSIVDEIVIDADPVFIEHEEDFPADDDGVRGRPICHNYTDTGFSYHTLGPSIDHAGVVIVNWEAFEIETVVAPNQVRANCGTLGHPTENKFYLTAGAPSNHEPTGGVGEWYVFDAEEHRPIDPDTGEIIEGEFTYEDVSRGSEGLDAHGFWFISEDELWLVNRETDDGLIINPATDEVVEEFETPQAPDIMWGSPDGEYLFTSLRGSEPVSGDPHAATGETPGFSVHHAESRDLVEIVQPDEGNPESDFHGIGVKIKSSTRLEQ